MARLLAAFAAIPNCLCALKSSNARLIPPVLPAPGPSSPPPPLRVRSAGNQFPITVAEGQGARFRDVDGLEYVDFCLGDTGAMAGHAPAATVQVRSQAAWRRWPPTGAHTAA